MQVLWFPPPIKLPLYNWYIIESGVKYHNPNHTQLLVSIHTFANTRTQIRRPKILIYKNTSIDSDYLFEIYLQTLLM